LCYLDPMNILIFLVPMAVASVFAFLMLRSELR